MNEPAESARAIAATLGRRDIKVSSKLSAGDLPVLVANRKASRAYRRPHGGNER